VVASVETDKVTIEVRTTEAGTLTKWFADVGQTVTVGANFYELDTDGAAGAAPPPPPPKAAAPAPAAAPPPKPAAAAPPPPKPAPAAPKPAAAPAPAPAPADGDASHPRSGIATVFQRLSPFKARGLRSTVNLALEWGPSDSR
jgi:2-oxoglutarate dehydrogenase E2 component (dihydrolipoamide succinyltransferase)